ncbi:hydroxyacyl-thioester dehydratase type 2, mitochondrial-like [Oratosquilla oratoria]|uniref:hydroxyacyl-thioester dehydratase type 2, mitochondrial-like n=1 Tax=Oratosquilla oratoria TaxID=337810 RepID=UPI003F76F9B1
MQSLLTCLRSTASSCLPVISVASTTRSLAFQAGDCVQVCRKVTIEDVKAFAQLSGDTNPVHINKYFVSEKTNLEGCIVHGALLNAFVSSVIGTRLPGPGTLVLEQQLHFPAACLVGEEVQITVTLRSLRKIAKVDFVCSVDGEKTVLHGNAKLLVPKEFK